MFLYIRHSKIQFKVHGLTTNSSFVSFCFSVHRYKFMIEADLSLNIIR